MGEPVLAMKDQAAEWVARMDAGGWSGTEEAELQRWLAENPRHHGALLQAQAAWATTDLTLARPSVESNKPHAGWITRRGMVRLGGAAIAAFVVGAVIWSSAPVRYATAIGEIRRVPLADGSIAAINTASRLDVLVADRRRQVRIERGEAWFQVAKDPNRPFLVEAGRVRVQAFGTAFSVRRRDNGAEVLVTEGVVEAWADGVEGHRVRLAAGSRAFVSDDAAIRQAPVAPSSVDRTLAWRSGKIDLVGDRLDSAVAEFNRYNSRQLVIVDPMLKAEEFDGVFRTDDPEGFAVAIRNSLNVPVDMSDPAEISIGRTRG